jgi:hypothetical protein
VGSIFWQPTFGPGRNCSVFQILDSDKRRANFYRILGTESLKTPLYVTSPQLTRAARSQNGALACSSLAS